MNTITLPTLEKMIGQGCQAPGCDHKHDPTLFLHSRCHPEGEVEVSYTKDDGFVLVACRECGKEIAKVKVAKE